MNPPPSPDSAAEIRRAILGILYEASRNSAHRLVRFDALASQLQLPSDQVQFHLRYLTDKHWIEPTRRTLGVQIILYYHITTDGIDLVESPSEFNQRLPVIHSVSYHIHGDLITAGGDVIKSQGDVIQAQGDVTKVGDITDSAGIAVGTAAQSTASEHAHAPNAMGSIFVTMHQMLAAKPDSPSKQTALHALQKLQAEACRGNRAERAAVAEWWGCLQTATPDVSQLAVQLLRTPIAGLSPVFQDVAGSLQGGSGLP